MSEPGTEWPALLEQLQDGATITPADFLIELRRIADALAGQSDDCDGVNPKTGQRCVLAETHRGHHVPRDGEEPWLDS